METSNILPVKKINLKMMNILSIWQSFIILPPPIFYCLSVIKNIIHLF